jgi:hypothetical protein
MKMLLNNQNIDVIRDASDTDMFYKNLICKCQFFEQNKILQIKVKKETFVKMVFLFISKER